MCVGDRPGGVWDFRPERGGLHGPPAAPKVHSIAVEGDPFVEQPPALAVPGGTGQRDSPRRIDDPVPGQAGLGG